MQREIGETNRSRKKIVKEILLALLIFLSLHVGVYLYLSCNGGYYFNQSGRVRYQTTGLATSDISTWNPKGCRFQYEFKNTRGESVSRSNDLGYLFAPLIMLDQKWFHPTIVLIKPEKPNETYRFPL